MKAIVKSVVAVCLFMSVLSGCVERRYYRTNHAHSPRYVQRHSARVVIHN